MTGGENSGECILATYLMVVHLISLHSNIGEQHDAMIFKRIWMWFTFIRNLFELEVRSCWPLGILSITEQWRSGTDSLVTYLLYNRWKLLSPIGRILFQYFLSHEKEYFIGKYYETTMFVNIIYANVIHLCMGFFCNQRWGSADHWEYCP